MPNSEQPNHRTLEQPERVAGRYVLQAELGKGGMGAVYRAWDEAGNRHVAFKRVLASFQGEQRRKVEALFEREYYTLVRLKHPRIIEVYDYGVAEGGPYYTMELLEGDELQHKAPWPYRELCRHLRDIASSLALIHTHQLVHRDVSPRNIRFTKLGRAKLIDFGTLSPFGSATEVVGTPSCMAPEALNALPLDQRTDLFALGAVAYFALTGHAAYPARRLSELRSVWQTPPAPPSYYDPRIPGELDLLVLSLLKLDPLGRPANAAAVIDQLTALAGLEPEEHEHTAEAYVTSSALVGRSAEFDWIERRTARLTSGKGTEIIIEGPSGIGKTRLLREAALKTQLGGAVIVQVDAQANPGSFGVVSALACQLLAACPEIALRASEPHRGHLGHLSAELWEKLGRPELLPLEKNPGERRALLQTALYDWFLDVVKQRMLLIGVDNLQAADDNSAAFLAALGRSARELPIAVIVTQRSGERVLAAGPVRALRRRAGLLKLGSLTSGDYSELVKCLFGDVANAGRLAMLLYEKCAGNPQQTMDCVRLLVRKRVVRYVGGTWVLPLEVTDDELPTRLEGLIDARVAALSPSARSLLEALSLHAKPLFIELCHSLVREQSDATFHAALDELLTERILVADGANYRFAQATVRETVLARLDGDTRRRHHRRAAEVFLAMSESDLAARMEGGWHLLRAGDEERGAQILAAVGRAFVADQSGGENSEQGVRALRAVLEIYDKHGRSDYEIARVLFPLLPLCYFVDWRLVNEYGKRAIELGLRITGLGLARRLKPVLGPKLALATGLGVAKVRMDRERKRGIDYDLRGAIASFCAMVPAIAGVAATCLDTPRLEHFLELIEPLGYFDEREFPRLIYDHTVAETAINTIRGEGLQQLADVARRFHERAVKELLGEGHWKAMYGGVAFMLGLANAYEVGKAALERAREMDELGVRVWAMTADHLRLLHHAMRGESEKVQHYLARVEVFAVQGSTTWQADMFYPTSLFNAHILTEDTVAIRQVWEQLSRRADEVPSLRMHADAAHAAYIGLRGELDLAIAEFERVLPHFSPRARANWHTVRSFYAKFLNQSGQHAKAKELAAQVLAHTTPEDQRVILLTLEAHRQLALAHAGLGEYGQAIEVVGTLLERYEGADQPLLVGLLHQARAEVALAMRDRATFDHHAREMERAFRPARNPALLAQCERLIAKATRAGMRERARVRTTGSDVMLPHSLQTAPASLSELRLAADPCEQALRLLMQRAGARSGHLYVNWDGQIGLVCASPREGSPGPLESQLRELVQRAEVGSASARYEAYISEFPRLDVYQTAQSLGGFEVEQTPSTTAMNTTGRAADEELPSVFLHSVGLEAQTGPHQMFVLSARGAERANVIGGLILEMDPQNRFRLHAGLLEAVASILRDRLACEDGMSLV